MKKTIGILLLAVILVFSLTSCGGGGGGGSGISGVISKITGNTNGDKANKDNFAGKRFGDQGVWAGDASKATNFIFGTDGTVTVDLEGVSKGSCTYNKPTGLSNVTLEIKDSGGTVIFNQVVNFDNEAHSFNTHNKANSATITFNLF